MNIYILRHGETDENKRNCYYGSTDSSLNEAGKMQAEAASKLLKEIEFNKVYVSDKKRTKETAEICLNLNEENLIKDSRINEVSFGIFEGKSYEDIKKEFPDEYEDWIKDWKGFSPLGGENYYRFYNRVNDFMNEVIKNKDENILIITHGGVIRAIYCYVLDGCLDLYWKFASKNGDVSIIKYEYGNLFIDSITHV